MCASDLVRFLAAVLTTSAFALTASDSALAQEKKVDPAREALRRLQLEQRKFEQEKAKLTEEKAASDTQVKAAGAKAESARKQAAAAAKRIEALEKDIAAVQLEKEALGAKIADNEKRLAELDAQLQKTEAERQRLDATRQRLEAAVSQHQQTIVSCEGHNAKLHAHGVEILDKYRSKGCFDSTLQREPFTGLRRVEIENAIEDYRDKLDEHKLDAPAHTPAAAGGAG